MASEALDKALDAVAELTDEAEKLAVAREALGLPGGWVGDMKDAYDELMQKTAELWVERILVESE